MSLVIVAVLAYIALSKPTPKPQVFVTGGDVTIESGGDSGSTIDTAHSLISGAAGGAGTRLFGAASSSSGDTSDGSGFTATEAHL